MSVCASVSIPLHLYLYNVITKHSFKMITSFQPCLYLPTTVQMYKLLSVKSVFCFLHCSNRDTVKSHLSDSALSVWGECHTLWGSQRPLKQLSLHTVVGFMGEWNVQGLFGPSLELAHCPLQLVLLANMSGLAEPKFKARVTYAVTSATGIFIKHFFIVKFSIYAEK